MNTRKIKKIKLIICIIFLFNSVSLIVNADVNRIYEAYVDDRLVGYVDNKKEFKDVYKEFKEKLSNRIGTGIIKTKKVKFKNTREQVEAFTKEQIEKNIMQTMDAEIDAKIINVNNKNCGIIVNKEEGNEILKSLTRYYLNNLKADEKNIIEINVDADIKYIDTKVAVSKLNNVKQIVDNINNDNSIKNDIKIEVKLKEDKEVIIDPKTKIQLDESMYIGENKVIEGEAGSKNVIAEVVYCNGTKTREKIISENIIKQAKDRLEYRGVKTPIGNNIAFLERPTRGGGITSKFGARWGRNHNGIDIAGNIGEPVTAAYNGVIEEAGWVNGYGNMIMIKHEDSIDTIYGHLSTIKVNKGQQVQKGDIIGEVGNTGRSTGPHLHFELRSKGSPINPESYILGI
ncbi:M23 family metallopeptidase [Clostridium uliginosum]|uniref:G5 domain-containing protein n=1 Tax=Clostridium uliginosum TaxID=119641 RepID=A0A1I1QCN9_9CLOT|nr:M23 family metallopeptidase [Clostridium uliginosum]SFD19914.1 G5 domain-containing protein [Clostridium uliginosum]